ncbi:MAG TPA: hypothetical protein VD816_02980 [Ohtaekwangia sp.]|nr:hypothetical protein [Ohtaekwangia sp.]
MLYVPAKIVESAAFFAGSIPLSSGAKNPHATAAVVFQVQFVLDRPDIRLSVRPRARHGNASKYARFFASAQFRHYDIAAVCLSYQRGQESSRNFQGTAFQFLFNSRDLGYCTGGLLLWLGHDAVRLF